MGIAGLVCVWAFQIVEEVEILERIPSIILQNTYESPLFSLLVSFNFDFPAHKAFYFTFSFAVAVNGSNQSKIENP